MKIQKIGIGLLSLVVVELKPELVIRGPDFFGVVDAGALLARRIQVLDLSDIFIHRESGAGAATTLIIFFRYIGVGHFLFKQEIFFLLEKN